MALTVLLAIAAVPGAAHAATGPTLRVAGGAPVASVSSPWTVALVSAGEPAVDGQFCGGSVIGPRHVLTAAHCVAGLKASRITVVSGRPRLSDESTGQRTGVARIAVDPEWNDATGSADTAVLTLTREVAAPAVSLARSGDGAGTRAVVSGWGRTSADPDDEGSDVLREVAVTVRSHGACRASYGEDYRRSVMLCAGTARADACEGDSGGPLVVAGPGGRAAQIGVVSFGADECATGDAPGMYTRVSDRAAWISRTAGLDGGLSTPQPAVGGARPALLKRARFGRIWCPGARCSVEVRVSDSVGAVRLAVRALRPASRSRGRADRRVDARKVGRGRWIASIDLPYGHVRLSAVALRPDGRRAARPARLAVQVD